jgi:hypothetical protein
MGTMTSLLEKAGDILRQVAALFGVWGDTGPVDSVVALENFVATRSVYVAQKTLYGYVKTRMGTRYVAMFNDKNIIASLNIAKLHVFAACLSDLTLYAVATALHGLPVGNDERAAMARGCYAAGLRDNTGEAPEQFSAQDCVAEFDRRLAETDWNRAGRSDNFTRSPPALMQWAPIAENLKAFDGEIIENSVKFSWRDIREQFVKRLDAAAVGADWARRAA